MKITLKKISFYSLVSMLTCFMVGLFFIKGVLTWRNSSFVCDTNFIAQREDTKLSVVMSYYMKKDHGYTIIKGTLFHDGKEYNISRKNIFTFHTSQNLVYATSISVDKTPADNVTPAVLRGIIPDFYFINNKEIQFSIYYQGWDGYIFSTGYVPSFYCKRYDYKSGVFFDFMNVLDRIHL